MARESAPLSERLRLWSQQITVEQINNSTGTITYLHHDQQGSARPLTHGAEVPYVAGWGEGGELDAIRGYAETIDKIARRIEDSLPHGSQDT